MPRLIGATRYLVLLPITGLLLAAAAFFVFGGIGLIVTLVDSAFNLARGAGGLGGEALPAEVEIVEYVHRFLIGTVMYITAAGFYQLFVGDVSFPRWLRIDGTEELETNLIGVTVVVLAVNFMGAIFVIEPEQLMPYGVGIALPIAALALFVGLRTWSSSKSKLTEREIELIDEHAEEFVEAKRERIAEE